MKAGRDYAAMSDAPLNPIFERRSTGRFPVQEHSRWHKAANILKLLNLDVGFASSGYLPYQDQATGIFQH